MIGGNLNDLLRDSPVNQITNVTEDIYVDNIASFSQFELSIDENVINSRRIKKRYLTLIGEYHKPLSSVHNVSQCVGSIDVSEYITSVMNLNGTSNKYTYLLLEYNPSIDSSSSTVRSLNSANIQNTINMLNRNDLTNFVYGIDVREATTNMGKLYNQNVRYEKLSEIKRLYIDPLETLLDKNTLYWMSPIRKI
jgi:hypothetical protein